MFCKYCGAQLADDAVFCTKCGRSQAESLGTNSVPPKSTASHKKLLIGVISGGIAIFLIAGALFFNMQCIHHREKAAWIAKYAFSLDELKAYHAVYTDNAGNIKTINCYRLSKKQFRELWSNIPYTIHAGGRDWYSFSKQKTLILNYNDSVQKVMNKYDIIFGLPNSIGDDYLVTIINRKTGEVIFF